GCTSESGIYRKERGRNGERLIPRSHGLRGNAAGDALRPGRMPRRGVGCGRDAERRSPHSHAERGNEKAGRGDESNEGTRATGKKEPRGRAKTRGKVYTFPRVLACSRNDHSSICCTSSLSGGHSLSSPSSSICRSWASVMSNCLLTCSRDWGTVMMPVSWVATRSRKISRRC